MEKTPMTKLIEQLDQEIKKISLGGIRYYGLMQAKSMAESLIDEERKIIENTFQNASFHKGVSPEKYFFMTYIDND